MLLGRPRAPAGAAVAAIAGLAVFIGAPAHAATVPVDALGPAGDTHVLFPPFASATGYPPLVTAGNVGDVNGDGVDDTAMMIEGSRDYSPSVWVTYSPVALPRTVAAGEPGWSGLRLVGPNFWFAVTGLGDVNG